MVAYAAVSYIAEGRGEAGARHRQDRSRHVGRGRRAAGQLQRRQAHRVELSQRCRTIRCKEVVARDRQARCRRASWSSRSIACSRGSTRARSSRRTSTGVKADPPAIFYSTTPAVLVNLDGDPIWSPIKDNDLKFAVNTNWDLFQHAPTKTFYLRYDESWLTATDIKGPWKPAGKLPDSFTKLPADDNWKEVKAALPGQVADGLAGAEGVRQHDAGGADSAARRAELPAGRRHEAAVGEQHRKRRLPAGQDRPGLLPGVGPLVHRARLHGPVDVRDADAAGRLQEDPARARRDRACSRRCRAPTQAAEAVLLAQIPQTARVEQEAGEGARGRVPGRMPQFQPIEKTTVARAVEHRQGHHQGRRPLLHVLPGRLVHGHEPDRPVGSRPARCRARSTRSRSARRRTTSPTSPCRGRQRRRGRLRDRGGLHRHDDRVGLRGLGQRLLLPAVRTATAASTRTTARTTRPTGTTRRTTRGPAPTAAASSAYGPYGGAGVGARYNPRTGTYARGAAAYGPYGARGAAQRLQPAHRRGRRDAAGLERLRQLGIRPACSAAISGHRRRASPTTRTGTTTRVTQGSGGGEAVTRNTPGPGGGGVARTGSGDVYAGRDGNVYKKDAGGGWSEANGNNARPDTDHGRAAQSRFGRARRRRPAHDATTAASSGGRTGGSSYRPSGGGGATRGGGGGRRR